MKDLTRSTSTVVFAIMLIFTMGTTISAQTPEPIDSETPTAAPAGSASESEEHPSTNNQTDFSLTEVNESTSSEATSEADQQEATNSANQTMPSTPNADMASSSDTQAAGTPYAPPAQSPFQTAATPTLTTIEATWCDGTVNLSFDENTLTVGTELAVIAVDTDESRALTASYVTLVNGQTNYSATLDHSTWLSLDSVQIHAVILDGEHVLGTTTITSRSCALSTITIVEATCAGHLVLEVSDGEFKSNTIRVEFSSYRSDGRPYFIDVHQLSYDGPGQYVIQARPDVSKYQEFTVYADNAKSAADAIAVEKHVTGCVIEGDPSIEPLAQIRVEVNCTGRVIWSVVADGRHAGDQLVIKLYSTDPAVPYSDSYIYTETWPGLTGTASFFSQIPEADSFEAYVGSPDSSDPDAAFSTASVSNCLEGGPDSYGIAGVTAVSLSCDGTVSFRFTSGETGAPTDDLSLVWADISQSSWEALEHQVVQYPGRGTFTYIPQNPISADELHVTITTGEYVLAGSMYASIIVRGCLSQPDTGNVELSFTLCADETCDAPDSRADGSTVTWSITSIDGESLNQHIVGFAARQITPMTYTAILDGGVATTQTDPIPLGNYSVCVDPTLTGGPNGDVLIGDSPMCSEVELTEEGASTPVKADFTAEILEPTDPLAALIQIIIRIILQILGL